ncbi:MAG: GNAT family N-acetyltransferase [Phycisphaeraceae bacterium]|nr:GNAT family N-acetyltransferase [Phycisphaerae bacterium]MBX3393555.1 GNAT family N-acetyltransferase [Phycisphaeraceae bacterium]HRJ50498.1 GNAT family protein [Phycisphaerales bacterium]
MAREPQPTLATARLTLRPFRAEDAEQVTAAAGSCEIARTTLRIPHPYDPRMAEEFIASVNRGWADGTAAVFAGVESSTGTLVASAGLTIEPEHRRAELGYWVRVDRWGMGYATEASESLLQLAFTTLGLERVHAHAFASNPSSIRVLMKIGMKPEGVLRRHILKWGLWQDMAMFGILRDERSARCLDGP